MRRRALLVLTCLLIGSACAWQPDLSEPLTAVRAQTSWVYAGDGSILTSLHAEQDREDVSLDRIPEVFQLAVLSVEDRRFFDHGGIDVPAVIRAAFANLREGSVAEGGSTITQQYVKNVLLEPDRTVRRKVQEAALAMQLEHRYTKARILELYLNTIYFGNGAYGVGAAARRYFGVEVEQLDLPQAALLAGLIRSPSSSDPYRYPAAAVQRRRVVLDQMVAAGAITLAEASAAAETPIELADARARQRYPAGHFVERVKRLVLDDPRFGATPEVREQLLFAGGLRIATTLDARLQRAAEEAIGRVIPAGDDLPTAALVAIENKTGRVLALVGGPDFFGDQPWAKFDLASQKGRPAGSSFKPLVLAAAIEAGLPLDVAYPAPSRLTIPLQSGSWTVENYGGENGGSADLVEATVHSYNTVYAQLMQQVGPSQAVAVAHRLGITSPLVPYPSTVLGVNDVTPLEMAAAYSTFANRGLRVEPSMVDKITTDDGRILYERQRATNRALEAADADRVTAVLTQVIERGTGVGARIGRPAAGKTGTGQSWTDAWFVGFTPEITTAVWLGYPESQIEMVPPRTPIKVTGGSWPAAIWQQFMSAALADRPVSEFVAPPAYGPEVAAPKPVPDVIGFPEAEAVALLERDGWQVSRTSVPSSSYPPGIVVATSPGPGEEVPGGGVVTVQVSNGESELGEVPDLLGRTRAQAEAALKAAGFVPKVTIAEESDGAAVTGRWGKVWRQRPASGSSRRLGSEVEVWVNPPAPPPSTTSTTSKPTTTTSSPT